MCGRMDKQADLAVRANWVPRHTPESNNQGYARGERGPQKHGLGGGTNTKEIIHLVHFKSKHPAAQTLFHPPRKGKTLLGCQIIVPIHPPCCYLGCLHHPCLWNQGQVWWEPTPPWALIHLHPTIKSSSRGARRPISERQKLRLAGNNGQLGVQSQQAGRADPKAQTSGFLILK